MQQDKKQTKDEPNTVTRELFVSTESDEPLREQMMDMEEDESEESKAPPQPDEE